MLQAIARVAARHLALEAFVDAQHNVDGRIAIGVRADLPPRLVRSARIRVEFLFAVHQNAVIVGTSHVGLRQAGGALGDRTVTNQLHRAHAEPIVAEPGADSRRGHAIQELVLHEAIDAER